jgi:HTH-type transcriptional regulator, sugar sensing transcriptional regulator
MRLDTETLTKVGLTYGESRVYIALVDLGSASIGPIMKKSGVSYSNIYNVLERLIQKGLVTFATKNRAKIFQIADPESLNDYISKKEGEIKKSMEITKALIPKIRSMQKIRTQEDAEIFLGSDGLKAAYFKASKDYTGEWLWMFQHDPDYTEEIDRVYLAVYNRLAHIKNKGIANETFRKSRLIKKYKDTYEVRFVDFPIPGNIDIIGDVVLITSFKKRFVVIMIKSAEIASYLREYFYSVWKLAKK